MKTKKITISVSLPEPGPDGILAGLAPEVAHPKLAKVRGAVAHLANKLERRKAEHAELEQRIAALPERIIRGESVEADLVKAIHTRDAALLVIAAAERQLAKERERLAAEEQAAKTAIAAEIRRRRAQLEQIEREFDEVSADIDLLRANLWGAEQRAGVGAL